MIKRFLVALVLLVAPSLAFADAANRAFLLTQDGTLFTVESAYTDELGIQSASTQVLVLTTRTDDKTSTALVPETLLGGQHTNPALAYDAASKSLFIFWQRATSNGLSSEATSVDSATYHYSRNIQVAVTRKIDQIGEKGDRSSVAGLTVHAVWWEDTGRNEWARYAMLTIENGLLTDIQIADLSLFTNVSREVPGPRDAEFNNEVLRHPVLFESSSHDAVDAIFGDLLTNNMHRVTIKPTLYLKAGKDGGRLRVPIGVKDAGVGAPHFRTESNSRVSAISGDNDKLVLYATDKHGVNYVSFSDGTWSPARTLTVDDKISSEAAIEVLRRMVNAQ
jgi:hypothetical protein